MNTTHIAPTATLMYGPMFSEKSKNLIELSLQKEAQGYHTLHYSFLRNTINSRALEQELDARHLQGQSEAEQNEALIHLLSDYHFLRLKNKTLPVAVFIDEAQFGPTLLPVFIQILLDLGVEVHIACLYHDYQGNPFPLFEMLQQLFEHQEVCHALCEVCEAPALENQRLLDGVPSLEGELVVIDAAHGGKNEFTYAPRCEECFTRPVS